jgi:hypothetical protein
MKNVAYIKKIRLKNIRAFKNLEIDLSTNQGQRMASVIIGRNGTCKSTLLRCIAMGMSDTEIPVLLAESGGRLISDGEEHGVIGFILADRYGSDLGQIFYEIENQKSGDVLTSIVTQPSNHSNIGTNWNFFVCGYGPHRGSTGTSYKPGYRVLDSVATLFDYRQNLVDIELMLRRMKDYMGTQRYTRVQKGIKRILGLGDTHSIRIAKGGGVLVSGPEIGQDIPLDAWADGYRMTFNWLIDLYGWAMQADTVTEDGGIQGVLLIDEIDQNLHPTLQSRLLEELAEVLPDMQIFATTHNPLTALGTGSENVISLQRKNDHVHMVQVPDLTGYSADDALLEEALFGTDPYPQRTRKKLDRHRELTGAAVEEISLVEEAEMKSLAAELSPEQLPSLRDDPVLKKLDKIADLLEKDKDS